MNESVTEFAVRRILVALDASSQSLAALKTAVVLAAELGADLEGLFVEDVNLVRVAMLPGARRVLYPSGTEEPLDSSLMEREFKVLAHRAQRSLALMAERSGIRWSFRVVRGKVTVEIMAAASRSDLLTVGKSGWSLARNKQLGSTAKHAALNAPKALLLAKQPLIVHRPVVVLFDGSTLAVQLLQAATQFAKALGSWLTIFLLTDSLQSAQSLQQQAADIIKAKGIQVRFQLLSATDVLQVATVIESQEAGLVVVGRQYERLPEGDVQELVRLVRNPVLLVR